MAWFDVMYRRYELEAGKTLTVPLLYAGNFQTGSLVIDVRSEPAEITVAGQNYTVFVCEVSDGGKIDDVHYVTEAGQLVRIERPAHNVMIELTDQAVS